MIWRSIGVVTDCIDFSTVAGVNELSLSVTLENSIIAAQPVSVRSSSVAVGWYFFMSARNFATPGLAVSVTSAVWLLNRIPSAAPLSAAMIWLGTIADSELMMP